MRGSEAVEITPEEARYVSFGNEKMLLGALAIGLLAGVLISRKALR